MKPIIIKLEGVTEDVKPFLAALIAETLNKAGFIVSHPHSSVEVLNEMRQGAHAEMVYEIKGALDMKIDTESRPILELTDFDCFVMGETNLTPRMKDEIAADMGNILKADFGTAFLKAATRIKRLRKIEGILRKDEGKE